MNAVHIFSDIIFVAYNRPDETQEFVERIVFLSFHQLESMTYTQLVEISLISHSLNSCHKKY